VTALFLIRHGQASYGADDYDVLSPRGVKQSQALGTHWGSRAHGLDAIYVGPRLRQRDTARHLVEAARAAGATYPEPVQLDELDEYPAFELLRHWMPILMEQSPEFRTLMATASASGDKVSMMDEVFKYIIGAWSRGELDVGHLESFRHFADRVVRGLGQIAETELALESAGAPRRHVAVVTSGGPISVAVRLALRLDDDATLRVGRVVRNASVSEFRARRADKGLTLIGFNAIPHLTDDELVTFR
jgi:broad specificity phosphatase PhoE